MSESPTREEWLAGLVGMPPLRLDACMRDADWRLCNLYWIIDKDKKPVLFVPNDAQADFLEELWHRNLVLKARQRGFSTAIQLLGLDTCLFVPNTSAAIIAQDKVATTIIFRRVKYAYDCLPDFVRELHPLVRETAEELIFGHPDNERSSFRVTTSGRSDTLSFLHISEYGKICARYPDKAREIATGALPAAEQGLICIESTAEGQEGDFYEKSSTAQKLKDANKKLSRLDFRFHFSGWWDADEYVLSPDFVTISGEENDYFNKIESIIGREIEPERRAWYIATRDTTFSGDWQLMKQEYPSTPEEAFEQSQEGVYYAMQMAAARRQGRITDLPYDPRVPVNTFWDLGRDDDMCIWFHQYVSGRNHFINFFEANDQAFSFYVQHMQSLGYTWGRHYLPHDGEHRQYGRFRLDTPEDMLYDLGLRNLMTVERTPNLTTAIRQCRDAFPTYWFDQTNCKAGLHHIDHYRKSWNDRIGAWSELPLKNGHQHAADALRQHSQVFVAPREEGSGKKSSRRKGGMAV